MLGNNWDDPRTMATLQMAAGLMAAGGPSKDPVNLGQGLLGGLDRYNSVLDQAKKMKMAEEELGIKKGTLDYHNREVKLKEAAAQREAEYVANLGKFLTGAAAPISATEALGQGAAAGSVGPTNVNAVRMTTQSQAGTPLIPGNHLTAMLLEATGPNKGKGVPDMYVKATTPDPLVIDGFVFDKRTMQIPPDGMFVPKVTTSADGKVMVTYRGIDGKFYTAPAIGSVEAAMKFAGANKAVDLATTLSDPKRLYVRPDGTTGPMGGTQLDAVVREAGPATQSVLSGLPGFGPSLTGGRPSPTQPQPPSPPSQSPFQIPPAVQGARDKDAVGILQDERKKLLAKAATGDQQANDALRLLDDEIAYRSKSVPAQQPAQQPAQKPAQQPAQQQSQYQLATPLTDAQKAADADYGKLFNEWKMGGAQDAKAQLLALQAAGQKLATKNVSGPITGKVPGWLAPIVIPDAVDTQDLIQSVGQRGLRAILGAQFTQNEGDRLLARLFNPNLDEKANQFRLNLFTNQLREAAEAKQAMADYYSKNGTTAGYQGKDYLNLQDVDSLIREKAKPLPSNPTAKNLSKGEIYNTPKGPLLWNGLKFEDIQ